MDDIQTIEAGRWTVEVRGEVIYGTGGNGFDPPPRMRTRLRYSATRDDGHRLDLMDADWGPLLGRIDRSGDIAAGLERELDGLAAVR